MRSEMKARRLEAKIRLLTFASGHRIGTLAAIRTIVEAVLPTRTAVVADEPGRVLVVIREPWFSRWLVLPAWGRRRVVRAVLPFVVAAGVRGEVRSAPIQVVEVTDA